MRIAVINITRGGISGGYEKYLVNVIPRIARNSKIDEVLIISPINWNLYNEFSSINNINTFNYQPSKSVSWISNTKLLRQRLYDFHPHIIYIPVERYFKYGNLPVVNMIQNMEPVKEGLRNPFFEMLRMKMRYLYLNKAVKKSDGVIAISEYVKGYLIEKLKISEDKIFLIPYGIEIPENNQDSCVPRMIPEKWAGNFVFTAGSIRPARGLEDLLSSMKHLLYEKNSNVNLVIAGETVPNMKQYKKKLEDYVQNQSLHSNICWVDKLNEKEMAWCYRNCLCFIMTSRVESFGYVALEAMSHGCLSIASDNTSIPEIFGDTALYYAQGDAIYLSNIIMQVIKNDRQNYNQLREKAKERALTYSWDICAEKTVEALSTTRKAAIYK